MVVNVTIGLLLLLFGIIAGGYGIIVGAGGGFIFVPALIIILKMDPVTAAAAGIVIVLINSFSGTIGYVRQQRIDYRTGIFIAIGALPGSLLGIWLLHIYSSHYFYVIFATVLVTLGIFLFFKNTRIKKNNSKVYEHSEQVGIQNTIVNSSPRIELGSTDMKKQEYKKGNIDIKWLLPLGLVMGILSSYLGIGGGWLLVPILIYFFKFPTHVATATSIFSLLIYSFYGVVSHLFYNNIDWIVVLWGGVGIIIGSQIGVKLSRHIPGKIIMQMLSFLLIVIGIRMYFE